MSVTIDAPVWVSQSSGIVRLTWSSDLTDPTYTVYRDGELVLTTTATEYVFAVASGEAPVIEVYDAAPAAGPEGYPSRMLLGWTAVADTDEYRVEQYVGTAWTTRATIDDTGAGYYTWRTGVLADDTTHQFRIVPVGDNGNDGDPLALTMLMVRHPDPPDVEFEYDAVAGTIAVSAG